KSIVIEIADGHEAEARAAEVFGLLSLHSRKNPHTLLEREARDGRHCRGTMGGIEAVGLKGWGKGPGEATDREQAGRQAKRQEAEQLCACYFALSHRQV